MGISTVTAGRIRKGQLKGNNGEDEVTYMESLPHLALSKVFTNKQKHTHLTKNDLTVQS